MMPDLFVDLARSIERACFDYLIIEDSSNVPYTFQNSHDVYLKYAAATPKLDPAVLVPYLAQATKRLGIVPTLSVTEYPPFLLARLVNSLDHVTRGRMGWNIVTGSNDGGAQNYGLPGQYPHDERYDRADEFTDIVTQLWQSWDPDAVVLDPKAPMFADGKKVHAINYDGQYFKCRGPLNAPQSPQGRPVICQAGGSPRGQTFAARWADTIIAAADGVETMKAFRQDVLARARAEGRDTSRIKILFLVSPLVDTTTEAAQERRRQDIRLAGEHIDMQLAMFSRTSGIDFSKFDLDEPLPALTTNGHQSSVARYAGRTLRELALIPSNSSGLDFTGSPDHVASLMQSVMEEVGGDGFLFSYGDFTRRYVAEITDGLVPELQRRGLTRVAYEHEHFRDNLMSF
jgi:FMN-dependent oxidoreductase (nitrilotriacetate monooxygenase family)